MVALFFVAALFFLQIVSNIFVVHAAIPSPHQWEDDATQEELDELIERSMLGHIKMRKNCNKLPGWEPEDMYKLTNASVVLLDEELLCADFKQTCAMKTRKEKEEWLLDRAAWFSAPHIDTGLHTAIIPHNPSQRKSGARRPCMGGRVLLLPVEDGDEHSYGSTAEKDISNTGTASATATEKKNQQQAWLDVKGVGTREPKDHSRVIEKRTHTNGLLDLSGGLWEFLNEKTLTAALDDHKQRYPSRSDQHFDTVGSYAVISLGFAYPFETSTKGEFVHFPAAGLVRQAARRHPNKYGFMDVTEAAVLEQIMNAYGMRSDSPGNDSKFAKYRNNHCRRANIQGMYRPRTVTDLSNVYVDEAGWPILPSDQLCLVHWVKSNLKFDTPLWNEHDLGSREVREFLAEELRLLPTDSTDIRLQTLRSFNNVRAERTWRAADDFWHGKIGVSEVEEVIHVGLIDNLFAADRRTKKEKQENDDTNTYDAIKDIKSEL